MAAKVFEKSAEETAFRAVLKEVYESGKKQRCCVVGGRGPFRTLSGNPVCVSFKGRLGSAAAGVKLRALCAFAAAKQRRRRPNTRTRRSSA